MPSKNLWGDFDKLESVRSPKTILQEQAQLLSDATDGVLDGIVEMRAQPRGQFRYDLDIDVPTLNHYVYTVLTIQHDVNLYPITVSSSNPPLSFECVDEDNFERALASILGSKEIKQILSALLAQAR